MKTYATRKNAVKAAEKIIAEFQTFAPVSYVIVATEDDRFAVLLGTSNSQDACFLANYAPVIHGRIPMGLLSEVAY